MKNLFAFLALFAFTNCGSAPEKNVSIAASPISTTANQTLDLTVNGNKKQMSDSDDVLSMGIVNQAFFSIAVMSEKQDIQFTISAYVPDLKPGVYAVYACKEATTCDAENEAKKQAVLYAPYPKDPLQDVSASRSAYNAPDLGLQPLMLTITSVTDEPQAGIPYKTKRVIGNFSGALAFLQQQGYEWKIVGEKTIVSGSFNMYCVFR